MFEDAGVEPPHVAIECGSVPVIRQLLIDGDFLTLLSPDQCAVELEAALALVQSVEPTGFGARSLSECLRLQLEALPGATPGRELALYLVAGSLQLVAERRLDQVRRELGASEADMKAAFNLIIALDPKPGASQGVPAEAAIPAGGVDPSVAQIPHRPRTAEGRWIGAAPTSLEP